MKKKTWLQTLRSTASEKASPAGLGYMLSERHKLIYLPIPKNANSFLQTLFLFNHEHAKDYCPEEQTALGYLAGQGRERFLCHRWSSLKGEDYTCFVVLRDPAKRLVSCYLDKFAKSNRHEAEVEAFCTSASRELGRSVTKDNLTFETFCEYVFRVPDRRRNIHYRSQASFVGKTTFDFYGDVDDLGEALSFLESRGFDTQLPERRNPAIDKTTPYGMACESERHPKRIPLAELCRMSSFPTHRAFYDQDLIGHFLTAYRRDVHLYLGMKHQSLDHYLEALRQG